MFHIQKHYCAKLVRIDDRYIHNSFDKNEIIVLSGIFLLIMVYGILKIRHLNHWTAEHQKHMLPKRHDPMSWGN